VAYTLTFVLPLGTSQTGLTLEAQLIDTAGADVGSAITTGFYEAGVGNYLWTGSIPDSHRGGVKFRLLGGGALKAVGAINPEEAENTDVKTSTRSTVATIWAAVADSPGVTTLLTRLTAARAGYLDTLNGIVAAIWAAVTDSSGVTTLLARLTSTRAGNLDNLDATVSSRLAAGSYTSPPSAATIAAAVWDYLTSAATTVGSLGKLLVDNINATISSRLASASYTAPDNSTITTINAKLGAITGSGLNTVLGFFRAIAAKAAALTGTDLSTGTTYDNTTDSLEAIRDRGDGFWTGGLTGGGANQVTITVTASAVPVVGAVVTVKNSGQTATIAGPVATNALGQVVFSLDDGSYKILIASSTTYAPFTPQTLTVSGTTSASCALTAFSPTAPVNAGTCVVYGYLLKKNGAVAPNVELSFEVVARHGLVTDSGQVVAQADAITATTNSSGYFSVELIRSGDLNPVRDGESVKYLARSEAANLRAEITVPSAASVDFQTLL
jgi:hypothetical protein